MRTHVSWQGNPRQYQQEAQARYAAHHDRGILPWSYITTRCDTGQCLRVQCMNLHQAKRLHYRAGTCVYCGEGGYQKDHLLPEPLTGAAIRALVLVVPSCGWCNATINDLPTPNVAERRRHAQVKLERKYAHLLLRPHKTAADILELGPAMASVAKKNNLLTERVKARLAWPIDPFYDLRAFQRAGIHDPESQGLCDTEAKPLRPEYQEAA